MAVFNKFFTDIYLEDYINNPAEVDSIPFFDQMLEALESNMSQSMSHDLRNEFMTTKFIIADFYKRDDLLYRTICLNKIYFTDKFKRDEIVDHISWSFVNASELFKLNNEILPLWFVFGYPEIAIWVYTDKLGFELWLERLNLKIRDFENSNISLHKDSISENLYGEYNFFGTNRSLNFNQLRKLIDHYRVNYSKSGSSFFG